MAADNRRGETIAGVAITCGMLETSATAQPRSSRLSFRTYIQLLFVVAVGAGATSELYLRDSSSRFM